jgi:hypothetical protein
VVSSRSSGDEYSRRARYLPGLLMLAPIGVVIAAAGWQDARLVTLISGAAVSIGVPFLLESFVRQQGLRFEVTELPGSSGRWTTTEMLWPVGDGDVAAARNAEHRRLVEAVTGRRLPDVVPSEPEGAHEVAAAIDESVSVVRALTRDGDHFPLLRAENAEYGMWRNLRGVRRHGRLTAAAAALAALVLIGLSVGDVVGSSTAELVVGLLVVAGLAAFWWRVPTDERVIQASRRYALALFDSARLLGRRDLDTVASEGDTTEPTAPGRNDP